jgi:L-ascorbate metabolism protein UlaG (beta-lactamase superfamily)
MDTANLYLRQNVLAEPLFNRWYAWSYLIFPATAAMYVANSHLKMMQSFVAAPQVHAAAHKNPAMLGGPFINYDVGRAGEIKSLLEKTTREQQDMLGLARAIKTLEETLASEATGYSLEPLYRSVPEVLKGYVELVYDLNNNPSVRFIEGLLYRSPYYKLSSQSVALSLIAGDDRPFVLSTPRLDDPGLLHLALPFADPALDELFKMKHTPRPLGFIREALGVGDGDELFPSFFTEEAPRRPAAYDGPGMRVRYFGHACLLIEAGGVSILCDPVVSYECGGPARYTYADLPESIDYVLITHNHQDHCLFETLLQLRHKTKNVIVPRSNGGVTVDPSLRLALSNIGFKHVREVDEMESVPFEGGEIIGVPFLGEHADLNVRTKIAYLVRAGDRTVMMAADSNNIEPRLYELIRDQFGRVDMLFLGMECDGAPLSWVYGPLMTKPLTRKMDQTRRFDGSNCKKGMDIVERLNPREVYVYAMGQEPWLTYITSIKYTDASRPIVESNMLVEECRSKGIMAERVYCRKELFV